jgi:hypothetical protein
LDFFFWPNPQHIVGDNFDQKRLLRIPMMRQCLDQPEESAHTDFFARFKDIQIVNAYVTSLITYLVDAEKIIRSICSILQSGDEKPSDPLP